MKSQNTIRKTKKKRNKNLEERMFYCGIHLDSESKSLLVDLLKTIEPNIPKFYHTKCEHVTIGFKRRLLSNEPHRGTDVKFTTNQFGFNDKAIAVRINDEDVFDTTDGKQIILGPHNNLHTTLATHEKKGSRESNNIRKWNKMDKITLTGTIGEFDSINGWNLLQG